MRTLSDLKTRLFDRRGFLSALAIGTAGLALAARRPAAASAEATSPTPKGEPAGYRESEHVRRAYAAAKF